MVAASQPESGKGSTRIHAISESETMTMAAYRFPFQSHSLSPASSTDYTSPESSRSSFSVPWTTTDSPTDSFLSSHVPALRSTGLEASRRLSSSSPFSDHYFLPSLSRDSCSPEVSQGVTKEPESVIRLSRHSRSLSGLSGSSRASLSLTPSSEFMPPPSAVGIQ